METIQGIGLALLTFLVIWFGFRAITIVIYYYKVGKNIRTNKVWSLSVTKYDKDGKVYEVETTITDNELLALVIFKRETERWGTNGKVVMDTLWIQANTSAPRWLDLFS